MTDATQHDRARRPALQMPQQAPPIDRTSHLPAGAPADTPGVEANYTPRPRFFNGFDPDDLIDALGLGKRP
ncbi:hypothetical protein [Streptomyces tendae]